MMVGIPQGFDIGLFGIQQVALSHTFQWCAPSLYQGQFIFVLPCTIMFYSSVEQFISKI
jgi:hypothetical protein